MTDLSIENDDDMTTILITALESETGLVKQC